MLGGSGRARRAELRTYERARAVKAASRRGDSGQRRIHGGGGNLHQIRHFGPDQRGPDRLAGIELGEHRAIERKLRDVGGRHVLDRRAAGRWSCSRRSAPRPAVTTRRSTWPATARVAAVHDAADDRNLGAAAGREQRGKARIVEHAQYLVESSSLPRRVKSRLLPRKIASRGLARAARRDRGQRLQQAMHVLPRASACRRAAPPARSDQHGLVIELRRRQRRGGRVLGARVAREPSGASRCRGCRRVGRAAASPALPAPCDSATLAVAVVGRLLDCNALERLGHRVVPAARRPPCSPSSRRRPAARWRASSRRRAAAGTRLPHRAPPRRARAAIGATSSFLAAPDEPVRRARRGVLAGSVSSRGWRWVGPGGGVVVSARITIGASRPLAPCTVITRTSSRAISMSRLTRPARCAARRRSPAATASRAARSRARD